MLAMMDTKNLSLNEIRVIMINLIERFKSSGAAAMEYINDLQEIGYIRLYQADHGERHYKFVSELNDTDRIKDELFDFGFSVYDTESGGYLVHTKFDEMENIHEF